MDDISNIFLNKEKCIYSVEIFKDLNNIDEIGTLVTTLNKKYDKIELISELEIHIQNAKEDTKTILQKKDFLPLVLELEISIADKKVNLTAEYKKKSLIIKSYSNGEKQKIKIKLPKLFFDNSSMIFLMRAFAFGLLDMKQFYISVPKTGTVALAKLQLTGEEEVDCKLGKIKCKGVILSMPDYPNMPSHKFLYNIESPHYLIKNVSGNQIIKINEIID